MNRVIDDGFLWSRIINHQLRFEFGGRQHNCWRAKCRVRKTQWMHSSARERQRVPIIISGRERGIQNILFYRYFRHEDRLEAPKKPDDQLIVIETAWKADDPSHMVALDPGTLKQIDLGEGVINRFVEELKVALMRERIFDQSPRRKRRLTSGGFCRFPHPIFPYDASVTSPNPVYLLHSNEPAIQATDFCDEWEPQELRGGSGARIATIGMKVRTRRTRREFSRGAILN